MAIIIGSSRSDEHYKYSGGAAGDQRQSTSPDFKGEVSMQNFYLHSKGWYVLRPKDPTTAEKMAALMKTACNNKHIGYSQSDRYGVIKAGINTTTNVNCDCSSLVRACVKEASGKDPGDFNTASEVSVLTKSGLFEPAVAYGSNTKLCNGDVLVTKTKGHTVIVVEGNPRVVSTTSTGNSATNSGHIPLNYQVGKVYTVQQTMNIRTKKAEQDPSVIPTGQIVGTRPKGSKVTCQATTLVNGKIWMYIGLDGGKRENWICADSGSVAYLA